MTIDYSGVQLYVRVFPPGAGAQRIDASERVLDFVFEDVESAADKLTLTLDNYDLAIFDDANWKKGNFVEVSFGYAGQMSDPTECVIQSVKGKNPIKVEAFAKSILMNKTVKSRLFEHVKRSDVVRKIAIENGYNEDELDIEDTGVVFPHITQAKVTDAQFVMSLAHREKFQFYVDSTGFHFSRRKMDKAPVLVLEHFTDPGIGDVLDFDVDNDVTAKPGAVTARGRDPIKKTTIDVTANDSNTQRTTVATQIDILDPETKTFTPTNVANIAGAAVGQTTAATADAAKREAAGAFIAAQQTAVILKVSARGRPRLKAKSIIEIKGISKRLSGRYYVKSIAHKISTSGDGVYTMDLLCRSDGTNGGAGAAGAKSKDGTTNTKPDADQKSLIPVQVLDPETKTFHTEYRKVEG